MIRVILFFVFTAVSAGLFADAPVTIATSSKWIIVDKSKTKHPSLHVTIRDQKGNAILDNTISKTTKFNLRYVQDGNYTLETEDNMAIYSQELLIDNGMIKELSQKTMYKPYYNEKENLIDMNLMAQGAPVKLTLKNNEGEALLTEHIKDKISVNRRFNTEKLAPGNYYIEVSTNDKVFTKSFTK